MTEQTTTEPGEVLLDGGLRVACWNEDEARYAWEQVRDNPAYRRAVDGLGAGDVILDVGGHIGLSALLFAQQAPGSRIYAFEPAPRVFDCLHRTMAASVPGGVALRTAVGAEDTRAELTFYPQMSMMSTLHVNRADDELNSGLMLDRFGITGPVREQFFQSRFEDEAERHDVEVTSLSTFLRRHELTEVALLKIDVERAELDVLRGIDEEHWPGIRRLAVEVHDVDGGLAEVRRLLTERGYDVEVGQEDFFAGGSVHMLSATRA
ncbi:FkbM family methyltransferase [Actinoalloteichus hoggarensis]|uniref:31-O-demethyl-FK506 methyltransferase FkbM n=1 Tax=Actinoalloteichus hoggarensis TaxID=1470176 RepID=A0A221W4F1_9PSEU|nr:FkbM family methyltransferase [Actinoalloteichus hoggarensis]ASO20654.1 31-O-demethyl-FK506 methyltransferase FkbM [Actinoalloteichus hoggarensis]MBB5924549.1 FkbM family methyltransferase [Actinoalloteichus hoggarensis]